MDPRIQGYLEANEKWAEGKEYVVPIEFLDMQKKGREKADGTIIIVACTDPRVTPEEFLGMSTAQGNKATIVRVAGGRVDAAMSTLLVLSAVGNHGKKGSIIIIHHTDCGLVHATDKEIRDSLLESVSDADKKEAKQVMKGMDFGSMKPEKSKMSLMMQALKNSHDPEHPETTSVITDVRKLLASPFFKGADIWGMLQDTQTGVLKVICEPTRLRRPEMGARASKPSVSV